MQGTWGKMITLIIMDSIFSLMLDLPIAYLAWVSRLPGSVMLLAQVFSLMFAVNIAVGIIVNTKINALNTISDFLMDFLIPIPSSIVALSFSYFYYF
jgi:hypothetical protein